MKIKFISLENRRTPNGRWCARLVWEKSDNDGFSDNHGCSDYEFSAYSQANSRHEAVVAVLKAAVDEEYNESVFNSSTEAEEDFVITDNKGNSLIDW